MYKNKWFISTAILASLLTMIPFSANAAKFDYCGNTAMTWKDKKITMHNTIKPGLLGFDSTKKMMQKWNAVKGSNFTFHHRGNSVSKSNGVNEIYFADTSKYGNALGVEFTRTHCVKYLIWGWAYPHYKESDIIMNYKTPWTVSPYTGEASNRINFGLVMLHELGHSLGLGHDSIEAATMNPYYPNGGTIGHHREIAPHADDRWGLRRLYPSNSTATDLAVTRFHLTGKSVKPNRVYDTNGVWTGHLKRGKQYDIEYTYAGLGTTGHATDVAFYLSKNNYMSDNDAFVGRVFRNAHSGFTVTQKYRFTVPSNLPLGKYHVFYKVDTNNKHAESNESNNFVSLLEVITIE